MSTCPILTARRGRPRSRPHRFLSAWSRLPLVQRSFGHLPPFPVLAVGAERCAGLAVELDEGHARTASPLELAAGASALPQEEAVGDRAESCQAGRALGDEVAAGFAADFADGRAAVGVDVEEGVPGVAAGEDLPLAEVGGGLRGQRLGAGGDGRGPVYR